jgi:hypothetical protein
MVTIGGANFSVMAASPRAFQQDRRNGGNRRSLSRSGAAGRLPKSTAGSKRGRGFEVAGCQAQLYACGLDRRGQQKCESPACRCQRPWRLFLIPVKGSALSRSAWSRVNDAASKAVDDLTKRCGVREPSCKVLTVPFSKSANERAPYLRLAFAFRRRLRLSKV